MTKSNKERLLEAIEEIKELCNLANDVCKKHPNFAWEQKNHKNL